MTRSLGFLSLLLAGSAPRPGVDRIVVGKVWTGDAANPQAQAVAIAGDSIVAVGDSATILKLAGVDLRDAATPEEFTRRIKAFAATLKPGEWITGGDWDHELWPGTPLPDRSWIDSVTPNNPVFVTRLDGHLSLANTAALTAASQLDSALTRATRHAASLGVTAMSSVSTSWSEVAALKRAHQAGALTFRVSNYLPLANWHAVAESLRVTGPGDGWIRVAGVKALLDGSLGSTTAYFDAPFADKPGTSSVLTTPIPSLRAWVTGADSAGLQVVTRETIDGKKVFVPEERISMAEALKAYTVDNAFAMYWDHQIGQLKPGLKADLVVVDRDLLTMPSAEIDRAKIRVTVVGGKVVYRAL